MSAKENKAVVRRVFEEMVDQGRLELADELIADDVEIHSPVPGAEGGREGFRRFIGGFLAGFPEQRTELHELISEGDRVAVRHTHHAVNTGEFLGMPPTGREVVVSGIEIFRLRDGQVAEFWHQDDLLGLLQQLGAIPGQPEEAGIA